MPKRAVNDLIDFWHALQQRSDPFGCQDIYADAGVMAVKPVQQGLHHDRITDPSGTDYQYTFHAVLTDSVRARGKRTF